MKSRALKFIDDNNILFNMGLGVGAVIGTADAKLQYVDDCTSALDNKLFTISIFFRFQQGIRYCEQGNYVVQTRETCDWGIPSTTISMNIWAIVKHMSITVPDSLRQLT